MAANTEVDVIRSRRLTLDGALVDNITFKQAYGTYLVSNEDDVDILTVTVDGATDPTVGGDDMFYVPPLSTLPIPADSNSLNVRVIGNGNVYSIIGV
jgi:hypothetical protein